MTRRGILTVAIAVVGLALSAALAWSASQLAGQRIGLESEPLSVARGLAPQHTAVHPAAPSHDDSGKRHPGPASKPTTAPQQASTTSTGRQIFTTPAPTATVTSAAPAPSAPAAATSLPASATTSGARSSSGAAGQRDDHHADD